MGSSRTIKFDAQNITLDSTDNGYFNVTVTTTYIDEVLNNFNPDDIITNYRYIDKLYEALKNKYEKQ